jgi:hypothetical protein
MKKFNFGIRLRVWAGSSIPLVPITSWASQADVSENGFAATSTRDDVLDLKCCGDQTLGCSTICAAIEEVLTNLPSEDNRDVLAHPRDTPVRWPSV